MIKWCWTTLVCLPVALLGLWLPVLAHAASHDVRIVIDVSGSMKDNDPHNLRVPSLRLLSGLMPADSRSGVWLFATQVERIIPVQAVNSSWRTTTHSAAEKIHNRGQFTDIEKALRAAIQNTDAASSANRNIILLSDGMVDLPAGETAIAQSRQRILNELLPQIKQLGFEVHTIALSANADKELLKALSIETNGWFRQVDTADELERIFLHLFEQAVQRDNVPVSDNHFSIDTSVEEMTVLIFREAGSAAAVLVQPDQQIVEQAMQSDTIRWQHERHYDLITLEQPMAGDWFIDAAIDPDNRVMVVTDLRIETNDLPNNVLVGERFDITAQLTEQDEPISREDFLRLVEAEITQKPAQGEALTNPLARLPNQTTFRVELGELFDVGRNDIIITAIGPTFERQRRQSINLIAVPLQIQVEQLETLLRTHRLTVSADDSLLATDGLEITALLRSPEGIEFPYEASLKQDNQWQLTLTDLQPSVNYHLALQVRGYTPQGRPVFLQPEAIVIADAQNPLPGDVSERQTTPADPQSTQSSEHAPVEDKAGQMLSNGVILAIGNLLIFILLGVGFWLWQRHRQRYAVSGELI